MGFGDTVTDFAADSIDVPDMLGHSDRLVCWSMVVSLHFGILAMTVAKKNISLAGN